MLRLLHHPVHIESHIDAWCYQYLLAFRASQQNSSPAPGPDPKPTMIDDWAVSVKPNADPTIIKKHIEKMVEVSFSALTRATSVLLTAVQMKSSLLIY